jgi:hypothetical protein
LGSLLDVTVSLDTYTRGWGASKNKRQKLYKDRRIRRHWRIEDIFVFNSKDI